MTFVSCGNCNNGDIYDSNGVHHYCECYKRYLANVRLGANLVNSGLLAKDYTESQFNQFGDYDFDKYAGADKNSNLLKLKKIVDCFDDEKLPYKSIHHYWCGNQGTQKTYTAKGMLSLLCKKGKSVYYIMSKDLSKLIMNEDFKDNTLLERILNVDCLVIDEFEEDRMALYNSNYKQNTMLPWLKKRLEVIRKSTILISNRNIEEMKKSRLGELFGDLVDRETKYCQLVFEDRYCDNMDTDEFASTMKALWG